MAEDVGVLVARVIADTEQFRSEMARVSKQLETNTARMNKALTSVQHSTSGIHDGIHLLTHALGLLGVAFSVHGIIGFVESTIKASAELKVMSERLNISVEALSELQYVAKLSDTDFQTLAKSLSIMTRTIGAATLGTKEAKQSFAALGVDFEYISKLPVDQQFAVIAEALSRVENESTRAALAQRVFGRSAVEIMNIINMGGPAFQAMVKQARDLGLVLSEEGAKKAEEAEQAIKRLTTSITAVGREMALVGAGPMATFFEVLRKGIFGVGNQNQLTEGDVAGELENRKKAVANLQSDLTALTAMSNKPFRLWDPATWIDYQKDVMRVTAALTQARMQLEIFQSFTDRVKTGQGFGLGTPKQDSQSIEDAVHGSTGIKGLLSPGGDGSPLQTIGSIFGFAGSQTIEDMAHGHLGLGNAPSGGEPIKKFEDASSELTDFLKEQQDKREKQLMESLNTEDEAVRASAEKQKEYRSMVNDYAIGLLQALGAKHRGAAIAAIVLSKFQAIAQLHIQSLLAQGQVMANLPPQAWPAASAAVRIKFGIMEALAAATGAVEISQLSSGGTQSTRGTAANPIATNVGSGSSDAASSMRGKHTVQITFQGPVYGWDEFMRKRIIASLRDVIDNQDVVIFGPDSQQAAVLLGG